MSNNKQRMRQGKFMAIWIPILSFLTLLCLIATIVISTMPKTMDAFFGRGNGTSSTLRGLTTGTSNIMA